MKIVKFPLIRELATTQRTLRALIRFLERWRADMRFRAERDRLYWREADCVLADLGLAREGKQSLQEPAEIIAFPHRQFVPACDQNDPLVHSQATRSTG